MTKPAESPTQSILTPLHASRPGEAPMTADVLWALPRVGAPIPSPDGAEVAVSVTTYDVETNRGSGRIWIVPSTGGDPRPLTSKARNAGQAAWSPDGTRLAFPASIETAADAKEKPPTQVHVIAADGGESECLTDMPLGVFDPRWLPDGGGIVFGAWLLAGHLSVEATAEEVKRRKDHPVQAHATEERFFRFWDTWLVDGKLPHLFHLDLESGEVRDLMPESTLWFPWLESTGAYDIAPDGSEIAFVALACVGEGGRPRGDVYRLSIKGGVPDRLTDDSVARTGQPRYTPDGAGILYGAVYDPDFYADRTRLLRYDRAAGTHDPVLTDWHLAPGGWELTRDGAICFAAEEDGGVNLFVLDPDPQDGQGTPRRLTTGGSSGGARPTADGHVVFSRHTLMDPPEIYRVRLAGGEPERLTRFSKPALANVAMGEVRRLAFAGAEDATVHAFVLLPPGYEEDQKRPLVHMIHGGPHGSFGDGWQWRWHAQSFAARGHVTALVNFHGSTSWGQEFAQCIQGAWGDRPYEDVMKATDALIDLGLVDEERMAISGGSYGGYLTAWIASNTDRFRCAVNHAGVYDLTIQFASDHTWSAKRNMGGLPWDDVEGFDRWNPARHAAGLNTPMMVVHGERDYRVPINQGLVCYGILKAKGIPARLLYFENENHWVLEPQNSLLWYREVLGWFDRFLTDDGDGAARG